MDNLTSGVRKPAVPVSSRPSFSSPVSHLGACFPGEDNMLLHRNNILFPGNLAYAETTVKTQDHSYAVCDDRIDPAIFLPYSQTNGVPQESKLATYMNRQNTSLTTNVLTKSLAGLSLDQSSVLKKVVAPEFVPAANRTSPSFLNSYTSPAFVRQPSVEDSPLAVSPRHTPQHSPPLSSCSPTPSVEKTAVTPVSAYQENVGGTTYFYPAATPDTSVLNDSTLSTGTAPSPMVLPSYHMYSGTPTHIPKPAPPTASFYISPDLRGEIMHKNALIQAHPDPEQYPDLPSEIDNYHELCPLKSALSNPMHKPQILGYPMSTYKATNIKSGVRFCLKRIHGYRLPNTKCMILVDMWKRLQHPNIVHLREVFTTKALGDYSIIFVYDYHPGAETLFTKHFSQVELPNGYADPFSSDPNAPRPYSHQKNTLLRQQQATMLPESMIWNYIIQLTAALRVIHAAGLACRTLDPSKILLTEESRIRLNCLAISDVLTFDASASNPLHLMSHYQQEDLVALGKVVLALACRSLMAVQRENVQTSLDLVARTYSSDLRNLILYLLTPQQTSGQQQQQQQQQRSVTDLMPMIGARFYTQLDALQLRADVLEDEVAKEMENGRLCRLLVKLGTINERPELNLDPTWSETGDRYMLKLFRDYLFHQVTEDGRPWLDMAHIVQCLNKLDAGTSDRICLMSRDEQSVLVVSYAELKHCLEQSFGEVDAAASKLDVVG